MGLRDERGMMAIGVALMLIVVLSLFGGALWQFSMAELKRVERTEQDVQALFLARAGAEIAMGAWQQELDSSKRPFGRLDPIYYDLDSESFVTTKPVSYLGPIEVEISQAEESEDFQDPPTEITSTAYVGSTSRTVKLVAYPFRYGDSLYWYDLENGRIKENGYPAPTDIVRVKTQGSAPLHFHYDTFLTSGSSASNRTVEFSAKYIVFDTPIRLGKDTSNLLSSPNGTVKLVLEAETIFLSGLEIMHQPERTVSIGILGELETKSSRTYSVELRLPVIDGQPQGKLGADILKDDPDAQVESDKWYGEVYFDTKSTLYRQYRWDARISLLPPWVTYSVKEDGYADLGLSRIHSSDGTYSRGAFYFEHPTVISSTSTDGLVPIHPNNAVDLDYVERLQPFFWDK